MRKWLRKNPLVRRAYWRARLAAGLPPGNESEVLYRLGKIRRTNAGGGRFFFDFPWGRFEYTSIGTLVSQYRDIFISKQYAFECESPKPVIVDCGGNIGLSAVWFKQNYPSCCLTVYEADPQIAEILKRNLLRAGYTDVNVRQQAVWAAEGTVGFYREGTDKGAISSKSSFLVPAIALAEHLPDRVDLLKLDIEGAEFLVIDHLCQTGAIERVQRLVVEFHVIRERADAFLATLTRLRESGIDVAIGSAVPSFALGRASSVAPFKAICDRNLLIEVYAWRRGGVPRPLCSGQHP